MDPVENQSGGAHARWTQSFAVLVGTLPEAAMLTDEREDVQYVNDAFTAMTGYRLEEVINRNFTLLHGPSTSEAEVRTMHDALERRDPYRGQLMSYRKDGTTFLDEMTIAPVIGPSGQVTHFIGLLRDVTDAVANTAELLSVLAATEHEHATSSALLAIAQSLAEEVSTTRVVHAVADALPGLCDADRAAIALWDPDTSRLTIAAHSGWPLRLAEVFEQHVVSPSVSAELAALMVDREPIMFDRSSGSARARSALERYEVEGCVAIPVHSATAWRGLLLAHWAESPVPTELGEDLRARLAGLAGLTAVALDNAQLLEETHWAAAHDPLTGLPNRTTLELRLAEALEQVGEFGATAVLFCDVDGLKRMNDSLGHAAGDRVLREVAVRLRGALRIEDTVSRVGGDEFVIVLANVKGEAEVQGILRRIEDSFERPVEVDGRDLRVHLSMGLAFSSDHPQQVPSRVTGSALIRAADLAMYRRKNHPSVPLSHIPLGRLHMLASDLPGALGRHEMSVAYQPQVDLATGTIVAVEALARWTHPTLGPVSPDEFISIAEMSASVSAIGTFVLETACRDIAALRQQFKNLTLAVNVSNDELDSYGFAARVGDALAIAAFPGSALVVEITESQLPSDRVTALDQLTQLRSMGIGVSLDDFGTGYTSLLQLRDLPVTELKVDRSYVEHDQAPGTDLLAGIVGLTHGLHLQAIAEGVSTEEHLARVRRAGFDRAQGFLFARPMSATALAQHLDGAATG